MKKQYIHYTRQFSLGATGKATFRSQLKRISFVDCFSIGEVALILKQKYISGIEYVLILLFLDRLDGCLTDRIYHQMRQRAV